MVYGPHGPSSIIWPTWLSPGLSPVHYDMLFLVYALSSHQAQLTCRVSNAASVTWMRNIYINYPDFLSIMLYLSDFLLLISSIQGSDSENLILTPKPLNCNFRVIWGSLRTCISIAIWHRCLGTAVNTSHWSHPEGDHLYSTPIIVKQRV